MSMVSIEQFNQYTNNYEDDPQHLKQTYLDSAEKIVCDYLGFDPRSKDYDKYFSGIGDYKLYLNARNITGIGFISVDGYPIDVTNIDTKEDYIFDRCHRLVFNPGIENIHVIFTAGYTQIPDLILLSIMRIAALMIAEEGGNIGVTGKAFGDNSRTFINYQNYEKYLRPLDVYRIVRFDG